MKNAIPVSKVGRSIIEFAQETSVCRSNIYKFMANGEIEFVKIGRRTIITTDPGSFLARFAKPATKVAKREVAHG